MPIHSLATFLGDTNTSQLFFGAAALATVVGVKAWSGGRKCTWERDWAGKMIMIVVSRDEGLSSLVIADLCTLGSTDSRHPVLNRSPVATSLSTPDPLPPTLPLPSA